MNERESPEVETAFWNIQIIYDLPYDSELPEELYIAEPDPAEYSRFLPVRQLQP